MRIRYWLGRTCDSLHRNGIRITTKKAAKKVIRKLVGQNILPISKRIIRDVLFINGCPPELLPHPYRYRVLHQIEQLEAGNLSCAEVLYTNLNPEIVKDFHTIILYRCPYTEQIGQAVEIAKKLNKRVLYDIDDLVIDTKYTDLLPYVHGLKKEEKANYDGYVNQMKKALCLCEGGITTTEALATELKNYVKEVFINRNCASEEMFKLSEKALLNKEQRESDNTVTIGYFSGSITHNSDFDMVKPAIIRILNEFSNTRLLILGELDLPKDLETFSDRVTKNPFVDWKELPDLIASVDINIAPITENIFNAAKSENKWVEAALVKVPTVASDFGAFKYAIENGKTGLLCKTENDWYENLKQLVTSKKLRESIAQNAFSVCSENYNTIKNAFKISSFIRKNTTKHVGLVLPAIAISGGVLVALKHACILKEAGCDVDLIVPESEKKSFCFNGFEFNVISYNKEVLVAHFDVLIATMWFTANFVNAYTRANRKLYLVQNYESQFYPYGEILKKEAEQTYFLNSSIEYSTISKWCQNWLKEKYQKNSMYVPNGIEISSFVPHKRNLKKEKIRILIEGDPASHYKNVDESFKIVEKLDKSKFEVWFMSYNAAPKSWYHVDRFLSKVPYEKVGQVYEQCDILIKSSWLESFSYPPLEMMATGGYCIVVPNGGNVEYLQDGCNCIFYPLGEIDVAVEKIHDLISDFELQGKLYDNGLSTANNRDWKNCKESILKLYE